MTNLLRKLGIGSLTLVSTAGILLWAPIASADVPLTRADVEALLNRVELLPRGASPRPARLADYLGRGDSLRTATASRAELRFNDGSLARIGQHATFQFVPNTRNFRLSNGTMLLLIPPGQGRSTIQTPNVVTGVQGTGLVIRYISTQNLTLVMALTESSAGPMSITTLDGQQETTLAAGQMALIQDNQIQVVEFDLGAFYQTSDLIQGLHLDDENYAGDHHDPVDAVRQETLAALENQPEFDVSTSFLNPEWIQTEESNLLAPPRELSPSININSSLSPAGRAVDGVNLNPSQALPAATVTGNANPADGVLSGINLNMPTQAVPIPVETVPGTEAIPPIPFGPGNNGAIPAMPASPNGPGNPATPATPAVPANQT